MNELLSLNLPNISTPISYLLLLTSIAHPVNTMAIALAEADKYEVLERIGTSTFIILLMSMKIKLTNGLGCGSFGIIRKVKRKSDGFVRPWTTAAGRRDTN